MHTAIQLIFDPQHDAHRALEVERAWHAHAAHAPLAPRESPTRARTQANVLVVLNGPHTACQRWILFDVMRAFVRGTPIVVVDVSCLRDAHKLRALRGRNPLDFLAAEAEAQTLWLKEFNPATQKWQTSRASSSVPRYTVPYPMEGNGPWLLSSIFPIYRWTDDWGERNLQIWAEQALRSVQPAEPAGTPVVPPCTVEALAAVQMESRATMPADVAHVVSRGASVATKSAIAEIAAN